MCVCCHFSCIWLYATPWTVTCQAPLSMRLSSQEYLSGLPCPTSYDLPNSWVKPVDPVTALQVDFLPTEPPGKPPKYYDYSAHRLSPWSGKKSPRNNATCNRGIYYWLKPGPPTLTKGVRTKGPEPQFFRIFIRSKKKKQQVVGTSGLVTQLQGNFLLAQRGAFSFPLIGSLFLARYMLIG